MGFSAFRRKRDSEEGATLKRYNSSRGHSTDTSKLGRSVQALGSGLKRGASGFADGFNNFELPQFEEERRCRSRSSRSGSDTEQEGDKSSEGEASVASTSPSSVDEVPVPSLVTSAPASTTPETEAGNTGKKVKFPSQYHQPKSRYSDIPEDERRKFAESLFGDSWTAVAGNSYKEKKLLVQSRKEFERREAEEKKANESGVAPSETRRTISRYAIMHYAGKLGREITDIMAYNGGVTDTDKNTIVLGLLGDRLKEEGYDGSVASVAWPDGWQNDAKPATRNLTVALIDEDDRKTYKDYLIPRMGISKSNGSALTAAEADTYYNQNFNYRVVTLEPAHPLWPKYANCAQHGEPLPFEMVDKLQLQNMRDREEAMLREGKTQAEVYSVWDEEFGASVQEGSDYVGFSNMANGIERTGRTGTGIEVTMTCGYPTRPDEQLTLDATRLGANPFSCPDPETMARATAKAKEYLANLPGYTANETKVRAELAAKQAAEQEEQSRAEARWRSTPWPLKSKNKATCLSDIPDPPPTNATDSSTNDPPVTDKTALTSWNGYPEEVWVSKLGTGRGGEPTEGNARRITEAFSMAERVRWQLKKTFPDLGEYSYMSAENRPKTQLTLPADGPAFTASSALGDAYLMGREQLDKIESEIPSYLLKHGIQTDSAAVATLVRAEDNRSAYNGQSIVDWALKPKWLPGTTEKLTSLQGLSRLSTRAMLANQFRMSLPVPSFMYDVDRVTACKTPEQAMAISTFATDIVTGPEMSKITDVDEWQQRLEAMQSSIGKNLTDDPDWTPKESTKL